MRPRARSWPPPSSCYEAAGVAERYHNEAFTLPQFVGEAGTVGGSLRFGAAGLDVANDGRPLLAQAEAAGLTPDLGMPHGHLPHLHPLADLRHRPQRRHRRAHHPRGTDVDIRVCVSVPVGDVEIDL